MTTKYKEPVTMTRNNIASARSTSYEVQIASTDDLIVKYDLDSQIGFKIRNLPSTRTPVTWQIKIKAGDSGRAYMNALSDLNLTFQTTAASHIHNAYLGPFDSARFAIAATSASDGITPKGVNTLKIEPFAILTSNITSSNGGYVSSNKLGSSQAFLVTPFKLAK